VAEEIKKAIMEMSLNPEMIDLLKNFRLKARFLRDNWKGSVWSVTV
jgi:hypothetical protein